MTKQLFGDNIRDYVLGGNATFTLVSRDSERHFTYKMQLSDNKPCLYFVRLLHGPDNENDYKYMGCYYSDTGIFYIDKKYRDRAEHTWPASMRAINYFLRHIDNVPDQLLVYHEGKCCRCGRKLTTPQSIRDGIGPECRRLAYGQ